MWFKVDDKFHDHPKVRDVNLEAIGLWTMSGSWVGEKLSDGFIPDTVARRWTSPAKLRRLSAWLVERGLWEPAEQGREQGWIFHDWEDCNPTSEETSTDVGRLRWRRKNALSKNKPLREAVCARDRNQCRYCGVRVRWEDRRSPEGGTYDHVDPDGGNTLENLVVACRRCNGIKKDRTPVEACMALLPVPEPYTDQAPEPDRSQIGSESDQAPPTRDGAEPGRTRVGVGSDSAPSSNGHAS